MIYVSRRLIITCLLLLIACVMAGVWGLRSGAVTLETSQVFAALMGDTPRSMTMVVTGMAFTTRADGAVDWRGAGRQRRDFSVADA